MPVVGGKIARHIVDPAFRGRLLFAECGSALHLLLVAIKERNLVCQAGEFVDVQLALVGALQNSFRLRRTTSENIAVSEVVISVSMVRVEFDGSLSLLLGAIELAHALQNRPREKKMGRHISGVTLNPQITGLPRLFE